MMHISSASQANSHSGLPVPLNAKGPWKNNVDVWKSQKPINPMPTIQLLSGIPVVLSISEITAGLGPKPLTDSEYKPLKVHMTMPLAVPRQEIMINTRMILEIKLPNTLPKATTGKVSPASMICSTERVADIEKTYDIYNIVQKIDPMIRASGRSLLGFFSSELMAVEEIHPSYEKAKAQTPAKIPSVGETELSIT